MKKPKKKLTPEEKAAKAKRQKEYMMVFFNGRQKRVKRPPSFEDFRTEEEMLMGADHIWLHQNGRWDILDKIYNPEQVLEDSYESIEDPDDSIVNSDESTSDLLPF